MVVAAAVHHHLAEHRADAVRLGRAERGVERRLEHRAIHDGGRRAGRGKGAIRERGQPLGGSLVEPLLEREDVAPEPGQEVEAGAHARVRQLRQVDVEVDHARQEHERPEVDDRAGRVPDGGVAPGRHGGDPAGRVHVDPPVRRVSCAARPERRQDAGPEHERRAVGEHDRHRPDATCAGDGERPHNARVDAAFDRLLTERLVIRRFSATDAAAFARYRSLPEVARYQSWETPYPIERAREFIERMEGHHPDEPGEWYQLAVATREDPTTLIGDCAFLARAPEPVIADIGYTFDSAYQGRGYATEAAGELVRYLFDDRGKHKVCADCDTRNDGSWRLLERLGFTPRGRVPGRVPRRRRLGRCLRLRPAIRRLA